ncbi:hypothetical protein JTB14_029826 [Gonioctena quinquepunctata]|nr:hypothetical protein JTB14_029826 [Gonioctena quinquepunctata]
MKLIISILLTLGVVSCEVPPPYPTRGFRPSQPFFLPIRNQPQTVYGPPPQNRPVAPQIQYGVPNTKDVEPVDILVRPLLSPSKFSSNFPQRYNPPQYQGQSEAYPQNNVKIVKGQLQVSYGVPSKQELPSVQYGAPQSTPPSRYQISKPTAGNNFQNPNSILPVNTQPQLTYGPPKQITEPQTQYGPPNTRDIETFERSQIQKIQDLNNQPPTVQYLPVREAGDFKLSERNVNSEQRLPVRGSLNFRNERPQLSEQYLPVKDATAFKNSFESSQNNGGDSGIPQTNYLQPQLDNPRMVTFLDNFDVTPYQVPSGNSRSRSFQANEPSTTKLGAKSDNPNQVNNYSTERNVGFNGGQSQYPHVRPGSNNIDIQQVEVKAWNSGGDGNNNNFGPSVVKPRNYDNVGTPRGIVGDSVTDIYLPVTSTPNPVLRRPSQPGPTPRPTQIPVEDEEEDTESATEQPSNPNIAIATAVAGGPRQQQQQEEQQQQFYLLQPDGRLQRVIYEKNREVGDQEYEYTANYHFQNIQADPNLVYAPLITLG